ATDGRQDGHGPGLRGRVVLRLRAAAGHLRVGRVSGGRDPPGERGGLLGRVRRDPARPHLARLHAESDRADACPGLHHAVVHRVHGGGSNAAAPALPIADGDPHAHAVADPVPDAEPASLAHRVRPAQPHAPAHAVAVLRRRADGWVGEDEDEAYEASLTANSRGPGTDSRGSVATTVVPRPGVECTMNVPLASSTRSRMEARPTRPIRRNSRALAASNPTPSSVTSMRSWPATASTATPMRTASACLPAFERASCTTR